MLVPQASCLSGEFDSAHLVSFPSVVGSIVASLVSPGGCVCLQVFSLKPGPVLTLLTPVICSALFWSSLFQLWRLSRLGFQAEVDRMARSSLLVLLVVGTATWPPGISVS